MLLLGDEHPVKHPDKGHIEPAPTLEPVALYTYSPDPCFLSSAHWPWYWSPLAKVYVPVPWRLPALNSPGRVRLQG